MQLTTLIRKCTFCTCSSFGDVLYGSTTCSNDMFCYSSLFLVHILLIYTYVTIILLYNVFFFSWKKLVDPIKLLPTHKMLNQAQRVQRRHLSQSKCAIQNSSNFRCVTSRLCLFCEDVVW